MALLLKTLRPEPVEDWVEAIRRFEPDLPVRVWPDVGNVADIEYAIICKNPQSEKYPGREFADYPRLRFIASVNAGVEYLLNDAELPATIPIVHAGSPDGDPMMTEYIVMNVLREHRQMARYRDQQYRRVWQRLPERSAAGKTVGFMGFGTIARPAAPILKALGFTVAAWKRHRADHAGVEVYAGSEELPAFLARTDVLVILLPLTAETHGVINSQTLSMLPRGASLINLGRGQHIVEEALLAALDSGHIASATLDVVRQEPPPADHPFWGHPAVTLMPHTARRVSAGTIVPQLIENIRRSRQGRPLRYVVDRAAGY